MTSDERFIDMKYRLTRFLEIPKLFQEVDFVIVMKKKYKIDIFCRQTKTLAAQGANW